MNRTEQRRLDKETARQLRYLQSGFDPETVQASQSLYFSSRSKYVPHIGKKRGGSGPVFADWYKAFQKLHTNSTITLNT